MPTCPHCGAPGHQQPPMFVAITPSMTVKDHDGIATSPAPLVLQP